MNARRIVLTLVAAAAGVGLMRAASGAPEVAGATTAAAMTTARPGGGPIAGPGRIEAASEEVDVAPERSGTLAEVLVEEGDTVRAGQVIARLARRDDEAVSRPPLPGSRSPRRRACAS